jgi:hypothetical protein
MPSIYKGLRIFVLCMGGNIGNKIYKEHEFFSYMNACVDVIGHFVLNLVTLIHDKKCTYLSIVQFFHLCSFHHGGDISLYVCVCV